MKRRIIEVDVDGVLANIHQSINPYMQSIYEGFDGDKHIESWGMQELDKLDERLRSSILKLFGEPEFIGNLKEYDGIVDSLKRLDDFCKSRGLQMIINTAVFKGCADARIQWLDNLLKKASIDCGVIVSNGGKKKMLNSLVCIEDNVDNLRKSEALIKVLIRRGHNRGYSHKDIGGNSMKLIFSSFNNAVDYIVNNV